jgi:hypothetical protein
MPDNGTCIPVPEQTPPAAAGPPRAWQVHDSLPRRPDRPAPYARYRLPLSTSGAVRSSSLGDAPSIFLMGPAGASVVLEKLQGEQGRASVAFVGELVGKTVVTRHHLREGAHEHDYLVIYGNLARASVKAGQLPAAGSKLGKLGNSAKADAVGLHLEVRRVRYGVDAAALPRESFRDRAHTIGCDPRNVFPLK